MRCVAKLGLAVLVTLAVGRREKSLREQVLASDEEEINTLSDDQALLSVSDQFNQMVIPPECPTRGADLWPLLAGGSLANRGFRSLQPVPTPDLQGMQFVINQIAPPNALTIPVLPTPNVWQLPIQGLAIDGLSRTADFGRVFQHVVKIGSQANLLLAPGATLRHIPSICPSAPAATLNKFPTPTQLISPSRVGCVAVLDESFSGLGMPSAMISAVQQAIGRPIDSQCRGVDALPDIIVFFGVPGAPTLGSVRISSKAYVLRTSNAKAPASAPSSTDFFSRLISSITTTLSTETCKWNVRVLDGPASAVPTLVLGKSFAAEVNTVFNPNMRTLSFHTDRLQCNRF